MAATRARWIAIALIALALPVLAPNAFFVFFAQTLAYTATAVIGLELLLGLTGQMSLGHAGFYALGAYGSALLAGKLEWPLWASVPAGAALAMVAGAAVGLVARRTRGLFLAMATLAFGYVVEIIAQRWVSLTGGTMGLMGLPVIDFGDLRRGSTWFLYLAALLLLCVQIASDYVHGSDPGRRMLALKESDAFAQTVGIDVGAWRTTVFALSALLAGLAGAMFAHQSGFVGSDAFGLRLTLDLLIAVVIGGLGNTNGPILGTFLILAIAELIAPLQSIALLLRGAILMGVLLLFPEGAIGLVRLLRRGRPRGGAPAAEVVEVPAAEGTHREEGARPEPPLERVEGARLEVEAVTKRFAGVVALSEVSLAVEPGTIHAIIGPNGAGKSTLINVLAGLSRADEGAVRLDAHDVTRMAPHRRARRGIARTFQNLQLIGSVSVLDNVMLGIPRSRGAVVGGFFRWLISPRFEEAERSRAAAILASLGIERLAAARPGELPYGHRKLLEIARAIAQRPRLMLLDEPIAGLNTSEARAIARVVRRIRESGVTVLLIEHNMEFVMALSDRVTVIDYGKKIAEGTPDEVRRDPRVIEAYLGKEAAPPGQRAHVTP